MAPRQLSGWEDAGGTLYWGRPVADTFDPYHKWLGIAPKDQPANRYRLLGIDLFESDPDVISSAADQRMVHIRAFQTGEYSEASQQLLNEVSQSRLCLLDPEKKLQYDASLRDGEELLCDVPTEDAEDLELEADHEVLPDDWGFMVRHHADLLENLKAAEGVSGDSQSDGLPCEVADPKGSSADVEVVFRPPMPGSIKLDVAEAEVIVPEAEVVPEPPLPRAAKPDVPARVAAGRIMWNGLCWALLFTILAIMFGVLVLWRIQIQAERVRSAAYGNNAGGEKVEAAEQDAKQMTPVKREPETEPEPNTAEQPSGDLASETPEEEHPREFHERAESVMQRAFETLDSSKDNHDDAAKQPPIQALPSGHLDWGWAFLKKHKPQQAAAFFNEAIVQDPDNATAHKLRGHAHLMAGNIGQATADFAWLVQRNPRDANAYIDRGLAHEANGDLDKALADFTRAIRLNPKSDLGYINRGAVYERLGRAAEAQVDFTKAIKLGREPQ